MDDPARVRAVFKRVEVARVSEAREGDAKLFVGRITLAREALHSPAFKVPCVYYRLRVLRLANKNGDKVIFTETVWISFFLTDSNGQKLFVPAPDEVMKVSPRHPAEAFCTPSRGVKYFTKEPLLAEAFKRNVPDAMESSMIAYALQEEVFRVSDQIAVFGIVTKEELDGVPVMVLRPCPESFYSDEYFKEKMWGGKQIKSWRAMTQEKALMATDKRALMGGIRIDPLPKSAKPSSTADPKDVVLHGQNSQGYVSVELSETKE